MKALTIRQPWATLIALGIKTIETRSWRAPKALIGQNIAIHAGAARVRYPAPCGLTGVYSVGHPHWTASLYFPDRGHIDMPLGTVVAVATLTDCVPMVSERDIPTLKPGGSAIAIAEPACPVQPCVNWLSPHPHHGRVIDKDRTGPLYDQLPYGDFQPGRWAWMLSNITPLVGVPAKGKQGVWEWS